MPAVTKLRWCAAKRLADSTATCWVGNLARTDSIWYIYIYYIIYIWFDSWQMLTRYDATRQARSSHASGLIRNRVPCVWQYHGFPQGACCMELQVWLIPRALGPGSPNFRDSIRFSTESILQSMDGLIWIFHKSSCRKVFLVGIQQVFNKVRKLKNWIGPWASMGREITPWALELVPRCSKAFLLPPQICAGRNCREPETLSGKQTLWKDL